MAPDGEKSDLLQGTLDVLILKVVALGPIHGYAIAQRLQQMSRDVLQVRQGSLYPALHRLEKRRWVRAEWAASETGRDARFYTLTPLGRRQLEDQHANWTRLSAAVTAILEAK
ncbi:MAG TPA: PadR family transcriptional regulator [Vicinamibacterales bacterium]|jgi:PadR family transcriptional regulator PadR|nr:PadR family transcriptional regulator [Vicinamibacterales bacterium]